MRSAMIYNFLIEANVLASIAILLMIPLRKGLRARIGNTALCFGWLLTAIRLLFPLSLPNPIIHEIRPAYLFDMGIRPIAGQIKVRVVDAIGELGLAFWEAGNRQGTVLMQEVAAGIDYNGYPVILAWVWLTGCMLVILWFVYKNIRFRTALKKNRVEEISGELEEIYLQLCRERKVRPVPVYFTDPVPGACLVGFFRPFIVLPVLTAPQDVRNVLLHEICHLKNRDHLWSLVRLLCCAVHWFNPLVWLAAAMSRTDGELRCDDCVTAPMDESERKDYAGVLVLAAAKKSMPGIGVMATGMTMAGKRLKNRIMTILSEKRTLRWLTVSFIATASLCLIAAFCTSEWGQRSAYGEQEAVHAVPAHQARRMPEDLKAWESEIWTLAGYGYADMAPYRTTAEDRHWESAGTMTRVFYDHEGISRYCTFAEDGTLLELQEMDAPWLGGDTNESRKFILNEDACQVISDKLMTFLETVNPGMGQTVDHMRIEWESELNGEIWMQAEGIPKDEDNGEWITFVVRLEPEWQLQYFACVSNG